MDWLKKHWDILAAGAAGILLLYWLYVEYQNEQTNSAQAAQSTDLQNQEQADEAAYAQQVALSQLGSDSSGGATGDSISTQGNVITSSTATPVTSPVAGVSSDPVASTGVDPTLLAPPPNQNPDYSFSQNPSVANNPNPIYPVGSPQSIALGFSSAANTLLGSGASPTASTPAPIVITPDLSDGSIPVHGTALPASPTPIEQATVRGFPGR